MQATAAAKKLAVAKKPMTAKSLTAVGKPTAAAASNEQKKRPGAGGGRRTLAPQRRQSPATAPSGERHQNEGHGRRLTMAFEALEAFPALAESRSRLLTVVSREHVATAHIVP